MALQIAGFRVGERKKLIDRTEFINPDGTIDHTRLIKKFDELGKHVYQESKLLRRI